jgi:16S rRNA (adenine1518-N6/adenine1519-N6)-dimethyltransferase
MAGTAHQLRPPRASRNLGFVLTPKRRPKLGQHFLSSASYRRRIADALAIRAADLVIEIGPGPGAMTGELAARASRVVAIEIDSELARRLELQFTGSQAVEVMRADILQVDIGEVCRRHDTADAYVFGNLPYYITSPILHHLLESPGPIRAMGFVVQLEVAERIAARPARRDYGYLSVLARLHFAPRIRFRIPPGAFSPPPDVVSALVVFDPLPQPVISGASHREPFLRFVKQSFAQKRKTLANNLAAQYGAARVRNALQAAGLEANVRAEGLSAPELLELFGKIAS